MDPDQYEPPVMIETGEFAETTMGTDYGWPEGGILFVFRLL
ncbi:lasso RiPP family leader peptide-containing protein [Streptomyces sp. NPDC001985]